MIWSSNKCAQEIARFTGPKFIAWHSNRHFQRLPDDLVFLYTTYTGATVRLRHDASCLGRSHSYQRCPPARFLHGLCPVILIGIDHNFANKGKANRTVVSEGDDPNHFSPSYSGKASAGNYRSGYVRNWLQPGA